MLAITLFFLLVVAVGDLIFPIILFVAMSYVNRNEENKKQKPIINLNQNDEPFFTVVTITDKDKTKVSYHIL